MIDEKKLINYIKAEINPYGRPFEGTVFEFGCKVMEHIENMDKVGEWIPVGERLPEVDGYFLITTSDGEIDVWQYDYSKGWGWVGFERIIAWMPLPAPYDMRKKVEE